ncbi:hypothetical protein CEXT_118391 [Caerostris extrusa]|uniref:Uncharacterized protein n=1 Tax=Caerostris extrusa TaxID=172846 RepID=A0AAV4UFT3_CAEEX|nr:hypothetical protein CEXT_118391 [Caerostris extrusa]
MNLEEGHVSRMPSPASTSPSPNDYRYQERRKVAFSVQQSLRSTLTDTSRCWKQALARHSKTSEQTSAFQTTREALQQPKKKSIEIAFRLDTGECEAHRNVFFILRYSIGWNLVKRHDFCFLGHDFEFRWGSSE